MAKVFLNHDKQIYFSQCINVYSNYNKTEYISPLFVQKYLKRIQLGFISIQLFTDQSKAHFEHRNSLLMRRDTFFFSIPWNKQ